MNWGNKLLVTFIVFAGGMAFLVYRSMKTNFELVDKDYYKNELRYQELIDAKHHVSQLNSAVQLNQTEDGILLVMPEEMKQQVLNGNIHFYCAYDEKMDRKFELIPNEQGEQLMDASMIRAGNYEARISWVHKGKHYYFAKKLVVQ